MGTTSIIDLRHRESGGVGYSRGYTSLDYFLTTQGTNWEFLLDLRGHVFNNGQFAGNGGIGMRFPLMDDKYMIGANVFYDFRQSSSLFTNQVGGGLEWLGPMFDVRVNGYAPVGKQQHLKTSGFKAFTGQTMTIIGHLKGALPSIEGEIGTPLPRHFYFAAGTYYLFKQDKDGINLGNAWGGRFRAEVDFGRYVSLEGVVTYDRIFNTRVQGVLSINIPLGKWKSNSKGKRCLRQVPIMRNEIIPIQTKREKGILTAGTGSDPVRFVFVDNLALRPGDGSITAPFASLKEAEANSQPGDVIYVFAGDGTPKGMNEGIILKDNQVIASSGVPLSIEDVIIPPQTPGYNPVITNIHQDQPVIGNPGSNELNGFVVLTPWDYIFGNWGYDPANDLAIENEVEDPESNGWEIAPEDREGGVSGIPSSSLPAQTGFSVWNYVPGMK
jgi:hypothetical protein